MHRRAALLFLVVLVVPAAWAGASGCAAAGALSPGTGPAANAEGNASPSTLAAEGGAPRACGYDSVDLRPCEEDCDRRLAFSCAILAARIEHGVPGADGGVVHDAPRALKLHERACELLDAPSCVNAARLVAAGAGAPPSRARQVELLEAACRLGDAVACTVPARAYGTGNGVPRDGKRAAELWERACSGGAAAACDAIDAGT